MPPRTVEQLFAAFLATGEEEAFAQLMRRSAPELRRLARRLGASSEDAEDLVQETMVAAIQTADRYDASRPLLPWLKGILTFRACKLARAATRRRLAYGRGDGGDPDAVAAVGPKIEDDLAGRELGADVRAAIGKLPAQYREPLQQFLLAERTPVEIARTLGVERATVRVRLHRGLRRLRERLLHWRGALLWWLLPWRGRRPSLRWSMLAIAVVGIGTALALRTGGAAPSLRDRVAAVPTSPTAMGADDRAMVAAGAAAADGRGSERERADASPAVTLAVRVRDAAGAPVANVGIAVAPAAGRDPVLHRQRAVTDANGVATFAQLGAGNVTVATDRGVAGTGTLTAGANELELIAAPGVAVQGRVVDEDGAPVPDARIWLSSSAADPWRGDDVAATDATGSFHLEQVPPGAFVVARAADRCASELHRCAADGEPELELRLGAAGLAAQVAVQDDAGIPVAGALVFVGEAMDATPLWLAQGAAPFRQPPCEGRTAADGTMTSAALPPGRHPVFVRAAGFAPYAATLDLARGRGPHRARLQRSGVLRGRVVDAAGHGIAGACAVFRCADPSASIDLQAGPDGAFAFECVPPGEGEIAARADGFVPRAVPVFAAMDTAPLQVELLPARQITGSLQLGGRPIAARVRAQWRDAALAEPIVHAVSRADGTFALAAANAERPRLFARVADEPLWRAVDAFASWVGDEVTVQLPADFAASSWLRGRIVCADGRALAAARLFVHGSGGWAEIGRSGGDGTFRLGPLPAGDYELFAESTRSELPTVPAGRHHLDVGGTTTVDIAAPTDGAIDLEFVRSDGEPIGDLAVTVVGTAIERRFALATGDRLRQALLPGDYVVFAMGSRVRWLEQYAVHVDAGATEHRRIELLPGRRCTLVPRGLPAATTAERRRFVLTAASGTPWSTTFTLAADAPLRLGAVLAAGNYELTWRDASGRRWRGDCTIDAGAGTASPCSVHMAPE